MQRPKVDVSGLLSRLALFAEIDPSHLAAIVEHTTEHKLDKGEMLFHKGDPARGFYVVVYGQIKLAFPSMHGNEKVVAIVGSQDSFGEAGMFMERTFPVFAEALTDTLVLHISKGPMLELIEREPMFARRMLAGLSMRLRQLIQDVEAYSLQSSSQRLIGYLLQLVTDPEQTSGRAEIDLPTTKHVIASRLNLTPETFSRILADLSHRRLIEVQGKHIVLNDLQKLAQYGA
ncbi:MAG: Crp/Fnr family transcriptional regulator [Rhodocyclaceae bacterium]|nr:Crp/Fnr family transcriptional regulator [Rhodocyclaceae bacterium]